MCVCVCVCVCVLKGWKGKITEKSNFIKYKKFTKEEEKHARKKKKKRKRSGMG